MSKNGGDSISFVSSCQGQWLWIAINYQEYGVFRRRSNDAQNRELKLPINKIPEVDGERCQNREFNLSLQINSKIYYESGYDKHLPIFQNLLA